MNKALHILVEIGHPAHVHFFRHPIRLWREAGHSVTIVTRDKEITHRLLDEIGLEYTPLSVQKTGFFAMLLELLYRWWRIFLIILARRIDVAVSISGISTAFPAWLAGRVAVTCTDTEDARLSNAVAFRFSSFVLTPESYLGKERIRRLVAYPGYHELAYLHPARFTPDPAGLREFGASVSEPYVVVRLVKWKALHDIRESGIGEESLRKILGLCRRNGCGVFLSSERPLAREFDPYMIKGRLSGVFDLMAFSAGFIGESPTMAVETALLGKPSVLINSRVGHLGNMIELEKRYDILHNFNDSEAAFGFLESQFFTDKARSLAGERRERLLKDKIDVSGWLADFVVRKTDERGRS